MDATCSPAEAEGRRGQRRDPRVLQVAFLGVFLAYVSLTRDFTLGLAQVAAVVASCLLAQAACVRALRLRPPGPLSPLITGLSLALLLRSGSLWVPAVAGIVAIASKFLLRWNGKHLFNPSLFGLLAVASLTDDGWISPGQWGSGALLAFGVAALGGTVVGAVGRADISLAFVGAWLGLLLARVVALGHDMDVFAHQASSGALILFAFFMISDPRSTPDARAGRVLFALATAAVAHVLRFHYFVADALPWALLACSPLTPLLDHAFRRARFEWRSPERSRPSPRTPHARHPHLDPASSRA